MDSQKTAIVTGANVGIGKETAKNLVKSGFRVILACRSAERAEQARQEITQETESQQVFVELLDLASLKSIAQFAERINQNYEKIDLLVNNAGIFTKSRRETEDGFEMMFGVNHLGHFYLTYLLLEKLKASSPSRVVILSSGAHAVGKVKFDDLQRNKSFSAFNAYAISKTCNILFGVHLAKLLQGTGVTCYSVHPGIVESELGRDYEGSCFFKCCAPLMKCVTKDPDTGCQTSMYCCLDPGIAEQSGLYYAKSKQKRAASFATNPDLASKLWDISLELCGLGSPSS